jgi:hypothetical protein
MPGEEKETLAQEKAASYSRLGHGVPLPASTGRQTSDRFPPGWKTVQRPPLRSRSGTADPEGHSTYEDELG